MVKTYPLVKAVRIATIGGMFLRATIRRKDGKPHRYWSVVENRRVRRGRFVQKTVL